MLMLRLAAEAGLRRAEVARVHTNDLTQGFDGPLLLVHGKGDRQRVVPITDDLGELVDAGPAGHTPGLPGHGWLFPGDDDGHLSPRYVGKLVAAALPDQWTMHSLRHRFATRAYRGTRNLRAVQTLLGHASVATTERYTAVDDDECRAAMMAAADRSTRLLRISRTAGINIAAACAALTFSLTVSPGEDQCQDPQTCSGGWYRDAATGVFHHLNTDPLQAA
jgi:integrase